MVLILCGSLLSQLASSGDRCTLKVVKSILDACSHLTSNYIRTNYEPYLPNLVLDYQRGSWQIIVPVLLRKTSSGILHLKSVPYHPSTNGLAKRPFQLFKQGMAKFTDRDLRDQISRFLALYWTTPLTTTGGLPSRTSSYLMHTGLDLLVPSVSTRVNHKQLHQKQAHDDKLQVWNIFVGKEIYTWE